MQGKQALLCHQPVEGDDLENAVNEQGKDVAKRFEQLTHPYLNDKIVGYPVAASYVFIVNDEPMYLNMVVVDKCAYEAVA